MMKKECDVQMTWHSKHYTEALRHYETESHNGLSAAAVKEKQQKFGLNTLPEKKRTSLIVKFFMQFNDFMIIVLIAAAGVSFLISLLNGHNDYFDSIIILFIVAVNAVLGLIQENKAEKSLDALKKMTTPKSKVQREGKIVEVDTEDLVPGDILVLETGDLITADARLISSINLKVEESALTGESEPSEKDAEVTVKEDAALGDRKNMVFSGSCISLGKGKAIVTATGQDTEVGKIAHMIMEDNSPETPLQKKLTQTGKLLGLGALAICFIIFFLGIFHKIDVFDMFMTSVSLAVAAIPEGLPAIVTIMLAIGVQKMARRNAIVRKLTAVEALGCANVICSDKTGTLTQNKMTVVEIRNSAGTLTGEDYATKIILRYAALCNNSVLNDNVLKGEPTEKALVQAALDANINKNDLDDQFVRVAEIPFDSKRKLMSTLHKDKDGKYISITKGAPDILLYKCTHYYEKGDVIPLGSQKQLQISKIISSMAEKALRVLAIGYREFRSMPKTEETEHNIVFLGLIGIMDPPRPEAKEAVAICKQAGIKPVMITGDHLLTAKAIAEDLGIASKADYAMTGTELDVISQEELNANIHKYSLFARVSPEHKLRIVKAFQSTGAVVAMTGDGVNDAPALKAADIGCAMGITGTEVAKGAADMILTDDNFSTIVAAVKEGRGIYANIRKAVHFLLSSNIGEIITMLTALLMGWSTPLLAIHLLWVNLVTDSLPAIALGLDPCDDNIMKQKPYRHTSLFSGGLWQKIATQGLMIGMLALLAFGIGHVFFDKNDSVVIGQTMAFATLSISQLVHAFNMRTEQSVFSIDIFGNKQLVYAFFMGLFLQVFVIMTPALAGIFKVCPLSPVQWLFVTLLCITPIFIVELQKSWENHRRRPLAADSSV